MRQRRSGSTRASSAVVIGCVAVLAAVAGALGVIASSPYEVTRLRNAFIAQYGEAGDFEWSPGEFPDSFRHELMPPPTPFSSALESIAAFDAGEASDLEAALAIAAHLASGPGVGDGIMADTLTTYTRILTERQGYCADYTQVFNGLAHAAGIPVREWGMSFDGYSGDGHAFNEIYDRQLGKWVLIDSFYSFHVSDAESGTPLSVLEFRERLTAAGGASSVDVHPIVAERFSFGSAERTLQYYRRGMDQLFLWFGNDVFSYDRSFAVRTFGGVSRSLEQAFAILLGDHPRMKLLPDESNVDAVRRLAVMRVGVLVSLVVALASVLVLAYQLVRWRRVRRLQREQFNH